MDVEYAIVAIIYSFVYYFCMTSQVSFNVLTRKHNNCEYFVSFPAHISSTCKDP